LTHMCVGKNLFKLIIKRSNQILLPLLVGVLFVVPIQLFAQMKQAGDMSLNFTGFIYAFYLEPKGYFVQYTSGIWPRFDVNHLWFLRSLWRFSIVLLILTPILQSERFKKCMSLLATRFSAVLALFVIPIVLVEFFLEGESVREYYGFVLLILGYCLGMQSTFWKTLLRHLRLLCVLSIGAILALQVGFVSIWQNEIHQSNSELVLLIEVIYIANKIFPLLAILALATRFLNRPSQLITMLSAYVFPLYILHQSVIIMVAYWATKSTIGFIRLAEWQIWLTLIVTSLLCASLLFIIARMNVLRVCFGMRLIQNKDPYQNWFINSIVFVLCLPLLIRLI